MTIVAHITTDGEQTDLSQVLTEFDEDTLIVEPENGSPSADTRTFEVRTSEGTILTQFHEVCIEHDITFHVQRIYHESNGTNRLAAIGENGSQ